MSLVPLHDRVLVKPFKPQEVTSSGIIIPDTAKEKPVQGEVLEVGGGRIAENGNKIPMTVKKGDTILFTKFGGTSISINGGEELLVLNESDILGILEFTKE
jgi:chaperonin GroES